MGLAAPKRRSKLSHDPNNTGWSRSSNSYGQKIMSAQGWKPGDYLGAQDASHSTHYTAANASHIRILLREDNLGLGAQIGKGNAETFGLSLYSGVLSRLNGKSDAEIARHQDALRDAELRTYQANKYGQMNFVRGGLLVGDTIQPVETLSELSTTKAEDLSQGGMSKRRKLSVEAQLENGSSRKGSVDVSDSSTRLLSSSTSRKATQLRETEASGEKSTKRKKKSKHAKEKSPIDQNQEYREASRGRSKKRGEGTAQVNDQNAEVSSSYTSSDRIETKEERRARKEEKKRKKEKKAAAKLSGKASQHDSIISADSTDDATKVASSATFSNRHAVRQRYIHQKRMAFIDPQAMKEIFMVTATG